MNITDTQITPAQLLTAAREGKITASVIDAETLPPLAGGDGPEQYPSCTIALQITPQIMTSGSGYMGLEDGAAQTLRTIRAWKYVYYSTDGDTLHGGRGTYDFRAVSSDGVTRGDCAVRVNWYGAHEPRAEFYLGEGASSVAPIKLDGLTEDEAEEVRDAIESAIENAYSYWNPEHPDESEIYAALVSRKPFSRGGATSIDAEIADETISVKLYAGTHCGQPQFAFEGDESETVYETAQGCAEMARERLELLFAAHPLPTADYVESALESIGYSLSDLRSYAIEPGRILISIADNSGDEEDADATLDELRAALPANASADWTGNSNTGGNGDTTSDCEITWTNPELDTAALDKQEREAAEALESSLKEE